MFHVVSLGICINSQKFISKQNSHNAKKKGKNEIVHRYWMDKQNVVYLLSNRCPAAHHLQNQLHTQQMVTEKGAYVIMLAI